MSFQSKRVVDALIKAMGERPDDFTMDQHNLRDRKSGMQVWITTGGPRVTHPFEMSFGPFQSMRFRHHLKVFKAWKTEQMLEVK